MRWLPVLATLAGCDGLFGLDRVKLDQPGLDAQPIDRDDSSRPDGEPTNCPADYDRTLPTTASRYKLVLSGATWPTAATECAANAMGAGTHLIVLSNEAEWEALKSEAATYLTEETWVGFTDRVTEGTYLWVTTEQTQVGSTPMASPWQADQPDADGNCVAMRPVSGALHDEVCGNDEITYICECDGHLDDVTRYSPP